MAGLDPVRPDRPLNIKIDRRDGVAVVALLGACTMDVSNQVQKKLVDLLTDKLPTMVIDMSGLDFIDSTGLGGIVAAHLRARRHRGVIRLVNPKPAIREILDVTRLIQLFPVDSS